MDSETIVAAGVDTNNSVVSPTGEGGVVEENGSGIGKKESSVSDRVLSSVGSGSEEEDVEGGFVSGEEDFDTASERPPGVTEDVEKLEEEEEDVAFVEPPETLKPIAKLSEDEDDEEIEVGEKERIGEDGVLGVEDAVGSVKENGVASSHDVAGVGNESEVENLGLGEKQVVMDNLEENKTSFAKPVGERVVEVDEVKFTELGDSVVEDIKVDVNVTEPRVAVVEDVKPETSSGTEKPELDLAATENEEMETGTEDANNVPKPSDLSEIVSERRTDNVTEVNSTSVKPAGESLVEVDGKKFTAEGDSVVESINADVIVSEPGVAIIKDVKPVIETSVGTENPEEADVSTIGETDKKVEAAQDDGSGENAKEEQSITLYSSNENLTVADGVKITSESNAVEEAIQDDLHGAGIVVNNDLEKKTFLPELEQSDVQLNRNLTDKDSGATYNQTEKKAELVGDGGNNVKEDADKLEETKDLEITRDIALLNGSLDEVEGNAKPAVDSGDSVAEAIHPNVLEPGVAVAEESNKDEQLEVKARESIGDEALEHVNGFEESGIVEEIQGTDFQAVQVPNENLEKGTDQGERREESNEPDHSAHTYEASITKDLGPEENGDDEIKRFLQQAHDIDNSVSDEETDEMVFGSSEAAKQFLEELEQRSAGGSHSGAESSRDPSQMVDGQIVTDSDEEVDTDDEGSGKELFDSAALAALLKAATGGGSDGNVTLSAQDVSSLFSAERPAGLGSSLRARPAPRQIQPNLFSSSAITARAESESNLSDEERKKLESIQHLRVKFLRLVHRLGQSSEDSIASQVLYRLVLVAGRPSGQAFSLDAAKRTAQELESQGDQNLNFSINILVIGKSGVGKSATVNSIFGENKAGIDAFEPATTSVKEISGIVDGVHIRVFDTPGLKTSVMDQGINRKLLASVKKVTKKCPPDIVLYVDRLDSQTRDLNDLPMLRTITSSLGPSIWRSAIVTLTHAASAPPDGPSGTPLSYEVFVAQRSHAVQQSIGQAVGDLRLMNPSLMNPVSLAENHPSCRKNRDGLKVLPNGQAWRPQLLMFCYSMKVLSEASALYKQQDPFDHQKLFGFRVRAPPLPYLLSWLLQSRTHPKLSAEQGGENGDSDVDLDDLSESEGEEEEDEYDQLPPFKPLRKAQLSKLNKEQLKAYYEEYDYRVKLLQKKQWKEELKRMREMKKGKMPESEFLGDDADPEGGAPAAVPVPLPDMVLPPSFDSDNPAYRYRFLEPSSQFLARPVLDNHGWDHDCGYDGVNLEQNLAIASRFPAAVTVQLTKDKKEFNVHLDSSVAAKHGENASTMAGFDIQNIGKKLAYIVRGETKFKNFKKNKTTAGFSVTFLGENVATGVKLEDQIPIGKRLVLVGSTGTVRSQKDAAYGANLEVKLREADFPIGQDQSSLGLSLVKWRGDLALGANLQSQFSVGRGSKIAVRLGLNNKSSGQITIRTSTSDQLQLALVGVLPLVIGVYKAIMSRVNDDYGAY